MRDYIDDHNSVSGHPRRDIGTDVNLYVDATNGPVAAIDDADDLEMTTISTPMTAISTGQTSRLAPPLTSAPTKRLGCRFDLNLKIRQPLF
jgi:hypothetical protein